MRAASSKLFRILLRLAAALVVAAGAHAAEPAADPPGRVARLNYTEGAVSFAPAGDNEFTDAEMNRPLVRGDRLWTDRGVRAEIQAGSAIVRMDGRTQLEVLALDDQSVKLSVPQGTVFVRVRSLPEGENFEVDTPNLAYRAAYPGDWRIDVDPVRGTTRVTIQSGTGAVYGDKGQAQPMGGGQQIVFNGRSLAQVDAHESPPQDNFDRWAAERNRREDQSVAARYVPRDVAGYQLLDASGEWRQDPQLGVVWLPQGLPANWAPYRNGRWEWIAPWGWTWIDQQPWAFATTHYGRWAQVNGRWAWVPGRMGLRPLYAPALVAFAGTGSGPISVGGKPAVAWFPLGPGEPWQPPYRASALYTSNVNANMPPVPTPATQYVFQHRPEAVSSVAAEDFTRTRAPRGGGLRVPAALLAAAQVVPPPAMPQHAPAVTRAQPPAEPPAHGAVPAAAVASPADTAIKPAQERLAQQQQQQQQRAADEAKRVETVRLAQQAQLAQQREAERARVEQAEQQRVAQRQQQHAEEQQRRQQLAQARIAQERAGQQRRAAEAQRVQQARRDQLARRDQARREQVAAAQRGREAENKARGRREAQARHAAQDGRRVAAARRDDELRRQAHAQQLEGALRAADHDAQVLAAQREAARQKQQQAVAEQLRRDQQLYEEQQRQRAQQRQRPEVRRQPPAGEPEVWQRGIPILPPGRTS